MEALLHDIDMIEHDVEGGREYAVHRLELIKTKAILLNVIALNELNWSFYYTKEELKNLRELKYIK